MILENLIKLFYAVAARILRTGGAREILDDKSNIDRDNYFKFS